MEEAACRERTLPLSNPDSPDDTVTVLFPLSLEAAEEMGPSTKQPQSWLALTVLIPTDDSKCSICQ